MNDNIITLYKSNFRDPASMLRVIADAIEAGQYGDVGCIGVTLLGDTMECFGGGTDGDAPSVAGLFAAAHLRLIKALESHGS